MRGGAGTSSNSVVVTVMGVLPDAIVKHPSPYQNTEAIRNLDTPNCQTNLLNSEEGTCTAPLVVHAYEREEIIALQDCIEKPAERCRPDELHVFCGLRPKKWLDYVQACS